MADLDYTCRMVGLALALLLAAPAPETAPAPRTVLERVVAVVRNPANAAPRPLTLTRLDEEARVALVSQGAQQAAFVTLDAPARRALLRWLVDQWLVADEATYRRFLGTTELPEEELQAILARGLRVQRFLDSRLARSARVSEEEVTRALAGQGLAAPSQAERDAARVRLSGERAQAQVKQLLADLRARADIRILVPELRAEPAP